jgi:hypothetical protein
MTQVIITGLVILRIGMSIQIEQLRIKQLFTRDGDVSKNDTSFLDTAGRLPYRPGF